MRITRVYLAGGLNGLTDAEANAWRTEATCLLPRDIGVIDPMSRDYRGKEDENVNAIVKGDQADILSCQAIIANCPRPSWGTAMEIAWSHANQVSPMGAKIRRCVAVVPVGQPISPWLRYHTDAIVPDVAAAVAQVLAWRDAA